MQRAQERLKTGKLKVAYLFRPEFRRKENEMDLKERERENARMCNAFFWLRTETRAGCCEHGNELMVSQIRDNSLTRSANTIFSMWTLNQGRVIYSFFVIITQISDNG
jgi:hypothetical protein